MTEPSTQPPIEDQETIDRRELQREIDTRSIYVGNVDFQATPEELQQFFKDAGLINRITILNDKFTGRPRGYAYIEFDSVDSIDKLLELDGSEFKNRILKVAIKRTNVPGKGIRGRGNRGRGRGRGFRRGGVRTRERGGIGHVNDDDDGAGIGVGNEEIRSDGAGVEQDNNN